MRCKWDGEEFVLPPELICEQCKGAGETSRPTYPGSPTSGKRECVSCRGSGVNPFIFSYAYHAHLLDEEYRNRNGIGAIAFVPPMWPLPRTRMEWLASQFVETVFPKTATVGVEKIVDMITLFTHYYGLKAATDGRTSTAKISISDWIKKHELQTKITAEAEAELLLIFRRLLDDN